MSALIILVNTDARALRHTEEKLSECGYLVAALTSFLEAKLLLESATPDLLIVDLRLAAYNGLQLAIRSRFDHPDVPVIVTHTSEDAVAEKDARHFGATFIAAPLENPDFLPRVHEAVAERQRSQRPPRRWVRRPVPRAVTVTAADAHAHIVDLSYGGVRLAFRESREIPATFDITVPAADVAVKVHRVWAAPAEADGVWCCGAELIEAPEGRWRQFVDTLRQSEKP
jgi:DNA-binding response OmpR family regulator